jgi:hypothetical protein
MGKGQFAKRVFNKHSRHPVLDTGLGFSSGSSIKKKPNPASATHWEPG